MSLGALRRALGVGALLVCVAGPAVGQQSDATIQQWIHENHKACCDHRDCRPAIVAMTFTGWRVLETGTVVPFHETIHWPFPVVYACIADGKVRCLFVNGGG